MNVAPATPTWPMYRTLVGIGMLCGLMIAVTFQGTRPVIERNRAEALERAVFAVLPAAIARATFALTAEGQFVPDTNATGQRVHAGFDADGQLVGVAIEAAGMGYADTITVLYGYSPLQEAIVGIRVLTSKETPGLGDKIETDEAFLENFVALDVRLDASGTSLQHRIETVKQGKKTEPWQIDGITGATISSVAIGDILAKSAERWVPTINEHLDRLSAGGQDDGT
ncbi:MAG: FMN-binding protein [Gammaproteobacteria bacterium]|nr:FMN-binding protein [Gammaproteobacteria bacterium]MDH3374610.1 FMN-binding protein [Gammaproteobacteria bacterium]MDH3410568.1 FMN-binding protein [Gammaproteobacteria bacterium]MDH3553910.1 FMN-binding protein [Gammaproteobacteria bacterium]